MNSRLRRALAPVTARARARAHDVVSADIRSEVDPQLAGLQGQVDAIKDVLAGLRVEIDALARQQGDLLADLRPIQSYTSTILNAIDSHNAAARDHERRLADLEARGDSGAAPATT